ncbi:MAG: hypothetical protein SFU98_12955 [Leptospiraceae bacterium]|nr:hypothetical protein [Leptospiraceae bacterium]
MKKLISIFSLAFLFSCDGFINIQNNIFVKHNINSKTYFSKFTGNCEIFYYLLEIKDVSFTPDPNKIWHEQKVSVSDGLLELSKATWHRESKYKIRLKCDKYKEITKIFDYPSIEPPYFYFELEEEVLPNKQK